MSTKKQSPKAISFKKYVGSVPHAKLKVLAIRLGKDLKWYSKMYKLQLSELLEAHEEHERMVATIRDLELSNLGLRALSTIATNRANDYAHQLDVLKAESLAHAACSDNENEHCAGSCTSSKAPDTLGLFTFVISEPGKSARLAVVQDVSLENAAMKLHSTLAAGSMTVPPFVYNPTAVMENSDSGVLFIAYVTE